MRKKYRLLREGEIIRIGDEVYIGGEWIKSVNGDLPKTSSLKIVGTNGRSYRRPITLGKRQTVEHRRLRNRKSGEK